MCHLSSKGPGLTTFLLATLDKSQDRTPSVNRYFLLLQDTFRTRPSDLSRSLEAHHTPLDR
jgi:hypothetical protein